MVLNNLLGVVGAIDQLRYVDKIVILEGKSDKTFFEKMLPKYRQFLGREEPNAYIDKVNGIDTLNDKLLTYSTAFDGIVPDSAKWIVIRDTDCVPISRQPDVKGTNLGYLRATNKDLYFQKGYGIESTFLTETDMFVKLILKYYSLNNTETLTVTSMVEDLNNTYAGKVLVSTDAIHEEFHSVF